MTIIQLGADTVVTQSTYLSVTGLTCAWHLPALSLLLNPFHRVDGGVAGAVMGLPASAGQVGASTQSDLPLHVPVGLPTFCCTHASSAGLQDPVTGLPAVLVKLYNVTQQKQMEAELQTQKEALARSVSHSRPHYLPQGILGACLRAAWVLVSGLPGCLSQGCLSPCRLQGDSKQDLSGLCIAGLTVHSACSAQTAQSHAPATAQLACLWWHKLQLQQPTCCTNVDSQDPRHSTWQRWQWIVSLSPRTSHTVRDKDYTGLCSLSVSHVSH